MFHSFYKLKISLAKLFSSQKSASCDFVLPHVHQSNAKQCLVTPVKISTLLEVFYSNLQCFTVNTACFLSTVLHEKLCFSTEKRPKIVVSRVLVEIEHKVTLFDKYFTKKSNLSVSSLP